MAKAVNIPVLSIQRRLKQHGITFNKLLNQAKFDLAKNKLRNSSLLITEITFQLGYTDAAHFTRAFRRWAGASPREYRQQTRNR